MSDKQWYSTLSAPMTKPQKKALLKKLQSPETITSLRRPQILMDFFTDSLNDPDLSIAIPSLTGLFTLITTRNLDYPQFYPRLYSLLTPELFHSKYRSRFLRHLDTFLAPTNHIPAAIIASFIKRMSRLSLFAPPAAIIAVVPFVYNLLQSHPTCTFMLHRHPYPPYTSSTTDLGTDPYDPSEPDPSRTCAIASSLWELHTLQDHANPTVAQICAVLARPFTKRAYNVDDFLDHGYGSLLETELKKDSTKEPVVEWRIPSKVFEREEGDTRPNVLLDNWTFY